jgi:hypothetical protein
MSDNDPKNPPADETPTDRIPVVEEKKPGK